MAHKKVTSNSSVFDSVAVDMQISNKVDRDVRQELLDQNFKEKTIDTFEQRLGIKTKPKTKAEDFIIKNKLFKLDYAADRELLNKLMNDPKYKIVKWSEAFNRDGAFFAFVIYSENTSVKEKIQPITNE